MSLTAALVAAALAAPLSQAVDAGLAALMQSQQAQLAAPAYRVRLTITSNGETRNLLVELVAPDRYQELLGGLEIIIVGHKTYQRQGNGAWSLFPVDMGATISSLQGSLSGDILKQFRVTALGPATLNGLPAQTYRVVYSTSGLKSDTRYWIGVRDHLPLRFETDGETPSQTIAGKKVGGQSHTVGVFEYDPKIQIKAPI